MGSMAASFGVRSTVSHFESSKSGSAHSGWPVFESIGESPTVDFHGP